MENSAVKNFFYRMLCGFFLGISIIAPGVSGSVMAVMMGIYDELITIISSPFKNFKKNFFYLMPMGIGAVLSIGSLIKVLKLLFENYPIPAYLLFIGLIAGSLPTVFKEANRDGFKKRFIIGTLCAFAFAFTIGMLANFNVSVSSNIPSYIYFPICGAIAGVTGMIPGMSVSMMLMMLGVYEPMLKSASNFEVLTMLPVAVTFLIGMVSFSNLTKYIFTRFHNFGYFMVFGFMIGSIISIIIGKIIRNFSGIQQDALNWLLSIVMICAGLFIAYIFQRLGKKFNTIES